MRNQLFALLSVFIVLAVFAPVSMAQDDTQASSTEEIDVEEIGLLPTNPFYFLKEWRRSIRRTFISDPVDKTQFELDVANEKSKELKRVERLNVGNKSALERATKNYEKAMERLRERLEKVEENSENPNIDRLLNNITERMAEHESRFENLSEKLESVRKIRERLRKFGDGVDRVLDSSGEDVERLEQVREKTLEVLKERKEDLRDVDFSRLPNELNEFRKRFEVKLNDSQRQTRTRPRSDTQKRDITQDE